MTTICMMVITKIPKQERTYCV